MGLFRYTFLEEICFALSFEKLINFTGEVLISKLNKYCSVFAKILKTKPLHCQVNQI